MPDVTPLAALVTVLVGSGGFVAYLRLRHTVEASIRKYLTEQLRERDERIDRLEARLERETELRRQTQEQMTAIRRALGALRRYFDRAVAALHAHDETAANALRAEADRDPDLKP